MKKPVVLVGIGVLVCGLAGCSASGDSLMKEQIRNMNDLADAMEKKDDARAAELKTKMDDTEKKLAALKLSDEEKKKLVERHQDEIQKASMRLAQAGMNRTMGEFGKVLGGGLPGLPQMPGAAPDQAQKSPRRNYGGKAG